MTLPDYIRTKGEAQTAELFGVTIRAIKSWRYKARYPRPHKAQEIVERTKGVVTFPEIYNQ